MMSRQMNAVSTSTLNQKQSQHQRAREKRSRHHQLKREGHDISQRSRQQLHRKEVVTTLGCRDNNSTERKSRQHLVVATSIVKNRRSRQHLAVATSNTKRKECATRSSCRDTNFTKDMSQPNKGFCDKD